VSIFFDILDRRYRYLGILTEPDAIGNKLICFGFWWFHIYIDTGDKY